MKRTVPALGAVLLPALLRAQPALTIYNQNVAVVRESVPLDPRAGENQVLFGEVYRARTLGSCPNHDVAGQFFFTVDFDLGPGTYNLTSAEDQPKKTPSPAVRGGSLAVAVEP